MKTYNVFSFVSAPKPQPASISASCETTVPGRRRRSSIKAYSVRVKKLVRSPLQFTRRASKYEITERQVGRNADGRTPPHRTNPGQEHIECEGFCDVVVGTKIEAPNDVLHGIARRHHDCRRMPPLIAKRAQYSYAINSRYHDVEQDHVEFSRPPELKGFL